MTAIRVNRMGARAVLSLFMFNGASLVQGAQGSGASSSSDGVVVQPPVEGVKRGEAPAAYESRFKLDDKGT